MKYAVIELTGEYRGYIVKRALFARTNRVFTGSYTECVTWIAGFKQALEDQAADNEKLITPRAAPGNLSREAS